MEGVRVHIDGESNKQKQSSTTRRSMQRSSQQKSAIASFIVSRAFSLPRSESNRMRVLYTS